MKIWCIVIDVIKMNHSICFIIHTLFNLYFDLKNLTFIYLKLIIWSRIFEGMGEAIWISASLFCDLWENISFWSPIFWFQDRSSFIFSKLTFNFKCMKLFRRDKKSKFPNPLSKWLISYGTCVLIPTLDSVW